MLGVPLTKNSPFVAFIGYCTQAMSTGPTAWKLPITPTSPAVILESSRAKLTAAAGAPALDIWLMTHSENLADGVVLSPAACELATKSLPACHTAEALMGADDCPAAMAASA